MAIQLQDFAKQVLFGTTMEDKLGFPREEIVDTVRGESIKTPKILSRPSHLKLREDGVKADHPRLAKLVDERERGKLLHFFGNHELLATELMALAILKFPDAPASFRRGLLETLKDEQMHTQLYMHRMKQCGVEFGELPLNDYFWRSVSSMEDPLDYVTRLSLTFEQANLDYSREYGKIFDSVGDASTAGILEKIYRDEIGHVGFGLKWFRRWKAEGKTDWEAYRERLVFPLSPARAKGNCFNSEGRSEAGLDEAFIGDLQVFSASRGRTPSVHWFNPEAERYAAQNSAEGLGENESPLKSDLAFLPAYVSRKDDLLLMARMPSADFLQRLQRAGIELPEVLCEGGDGRQAPAIERKIGDLRPWAWTPDSVSYFEKTVSSVTRPPAKEDLWNERRRDLFSKAWGAAWGRTLAASPAETSWIAPGEVYGRVVSSFEELIERRSCFAELGYSDIVCKAPFGTAANAIRCWFGREDLSTQLETWLAGVFEKQGAVVVEPWLDRVFDFSVQLERRDSKLRPVGFTRLVNNARGQFRGIVTNGFGNGLKPELLRFMMQRIEGRPRIYHYFEQELAPALEECLAAARFSGPLGIDAFIYRDAQDGLRLKPLVEINPRCTMGRVAFELGQRNAATSVGFFQIISRAQIKKSGSASFADHCEKQQWASPLLMSEEKRPRIREGSFPLNDPAAASRFLAMYHVRQSIDALSEWMG